METDLQLRLNFMQQTSRFLAATFFTTAGNSSDTSRPFATSLIINISFNQA